MCSIGGWRPRNPHSISIIIRHGSLLSFQHEPNFILHNVRRSFCWTNENSSLPFNLAKLWKGWSISALVQTCFKRSSSCSRNRSSTLKLCNSRNWNYPNRRIWFSTMNSLVCIKPWKDPLRVFWWPGRTIRRRKHSWILWQTISTNNKHRRWWHITMIWFVNKINNWISTNRKNSTVSTNRTARDRRSKISNKSCKPWKINTLCWRSRLDPVSAIPRKGESLSKQSSRIRFQRRTEKHLWATATGTGVSQKSHRKWREIPSTRSWSSSI